jgi:hypothetical protein
MRRPLAGILILVMILITIINSFLTVSTSFNPLWLAGICGWLAALLLFSDTPRILQVQVGVLIVISLGLIFHTSNQGISVDLNSIISGNTRLLAMIAAVGFLKLVVIPDSTTLRPLPVGKSTYLQTLIGLNLSASIINISAPIMIADRIHHQRPLQRFTSQSFTRVFCGVASWSPFFGAMAVVLTYVSDAQLSWIIIAGLPFTVAGFLVVYSEARMRYAEQIDSFVGYPMQFSSLKIPAVLVLSVVIAAWILPDTPVLIVIASCALLVTAVTLLIRAGIRSTLHQLNDYVVNGLPRIVNELTLFLAAGVLAAGMSAIIKNGALPNPFVVFDALTASKLLGIMMIMAAMGIHPVILISSFTPLMLSLDPDPNLLAVTYLFAWNLGTCSSPLSGTHLVFQGRYGLPSWKAAMWNWPYAIIMWLIALAWLHVVARFLP